MIDGSDGRNDKNEEKHACQSGENKTRVHLNPQFTYLPGRPLRQPPYSFKSIHYLPNEIAGSLALGMQNAAHSHLLMRAAIDHLEARSFPRALLQLHGHKMTGSAFRSKFPWVNFASDITADATADKLICADADDQAAPPWRRRHDPASGSAILRVVRCHRNGRYPAPRGVTVLSPCDAN
jgi:hypothetical protein